MRSMGLAISLLEPTSLTCEGVGVVLDTGNELGCVRVGWDADTTTWTRAVWGACDVVVSL